MGRAFVRYTDEDLSRARETDMIDFLEKQNNFTFKREGLSYRCKEHNSLVISSDRKRWYWNSRNMGGNNVLDWLQSAENLDFQTACSVVINKSSYEKSNFASAKEIKPAEKKPFLMPPAAEGSYKRVYAYLNQTRNINHEVLQYCFKNKLIYQDKKNNAVFVGYNENGVAAFAEKKGTLTDIQYRKNSSGSDKKYSFRIDSVNKENDTVFVFEAPIDLLAHCSINNLKAKAVGNPDWEKAFLNHNRLVLSGTSMVALEHYLSVRPHIKNITVCTDNDQAGKKSAQNIAEEYSAKGYSVLYMPSKKGKDYADYLAYIKKGKQPNANIKKKQP